MVVLAWRTMGCGMLVRCKAMWVAEVVGLLSTSAQHCDGKACFGGKFCTCGLRSWMN